MKTFLALVYFFASILVPLGLLWFGYFFAPPEFTLNREAVAVEQGILKNQERLFPDLKSRETFDDPETITGLVGQNDDYKVWLLVFEDKTQAKAAFKAYGKRVTERTGVRQMG